jgi:Ca2+-binding RTX toxin-like protein
MRLRARRSLLALLMVPTIGVWLAVTAGVAAAVDASKTPIDIDFEQDAPGSYPAGSSSVDSAQVGFATVDYAGTGDCAPPTTCDQPFQYSVIDVRGVDDSNAVTTSGIGVSWGIRITLAQPTQRLSLQIGDADQAPSQGDPTPFAVLVGFRDGVRVTSTSLQGDDDGFADQTLTLQGYVIDSAVVQWQDPIGTPRSGWPEIVDTVRSDPLCSVFGNNLANSLTGTADVDVICGGPGGDTISGLGDNDLLYGNGGTDTINGGPGRDRMVGGAASDTCNGGTGTDTAFGCEARTSVP